MKTLVGSLALIIALSGCTAVENTAQNVAPTKDEKFIIALETALPHFDVTNEDALVEAGRGVCDYFDEFGVSLMSLGILAEEFQKDFTQKETATLFVVSTSTYCPDTKDEILSLNGGLA